MEVQTTILKIRRKQLTKFQKETVAVANGAMVYNIWLDRNGKIFKLHGTISASSDQGESDLVSRSEKGEKV